MGPMNMGCLVQSDSKLCWHLFSEVVESDFTSKDKEIKVTLGCRMTKKVKSAAYKENLHFMVE